MDYSLVKGNIYEVTRVDHQFSNFIEVNTPRFPQFLSFMRFELVKENTNMFKVGDRVKCVNNREWTDVLEKNKIYTVASADSGTLCVKGAKYSFSVNRFELAEIEKTPLDIVKEMYEEAWRNGDSRLATYYEVLVEAFGVDVSVKAENYIFTYTSKKQG